LVLPARCRWVSELWESEEKIGKKQPGKNLITLPLALVFPLVFSSDVIVTFQFLLGLWPTSACVSCHPWLANDWCR
jgi:hypothetical protein